MKKDQKITHDYLTNEKKIISTCTTSTQALARLVEYRKMSNKKFSLGFICQKAAIPSRGYLSDV